MRASLLYKTKQKVSALHEGNFVLREATPTDNTEYNCHTVYHERFEAEKFHGFHSFYMVRETFYMKVKDGAVQIWI